MKCYEALPLNFRLYKEADFAGFSKENWIGVGISAVLLVAGVLLALGHPFSLLTETASSLKRLLYCLVLFALIMLSVRVQEKLHGFLIYRICGCPVEYNNSMGIYPCANSGHYFVEKKGWILSSLLPVGIWCVLTLAATFLVTEKWFWAPYLLFLVSIAGVGGKLVGTFMLARSPKGSVVQDNALTFKIYAPVDEVEAAEKAEAGEETETEPEAEE